MRAFLLLAAVTSALTSASPRQISAEDISVLSAASLTDAVTEIVDTYLRKTNDQVLVSFANSAALAKQIENEAPADIFISANLGWMDYLIENGLIKPTSRRDVLGNKLVLVTPVESKIDFKIKPYFPLAKMLGDGRLAIADPDFVPAGQYAAAALKWLNVWSEVASRLAPGRDVRNTLSLVERGETQLGIVYQTDVVGSRKVRIVDYFPTESHPPIIYSFGIISDHDSPAVLTFYDFLTGEEAMKIFKFYGFVPR